MDKINKDSDGIDNEVYIPDLNLDGLDFMRGLLFTVGIYAIIGIGAGLYCLVG